MIRRAAVCYFGGAVGAVANSLLVWLLAAAGVLAQIGVAMAPPLAWPWLSHRVLWGGIWGLGLVPLLPRLGPVRAGLLWSLAPSAAQLLYFFPRDGRDWLGLDLGLATPLVVLAANAVWGWVAARTIAAAGGS
jgi:hypothetical protein